IATYLTGDEVVVPLDELLSDPAYGLGGRKVRFDAPTEAEIVPQFLNECRIGSHCYALPYMRSTEACYVNRDFVEALGYTLPETLTWDFVWEVSEAAMAKDADGNFIINGQKVMIPFIYKSTDNMMIQLVRQKGSGYSTADGEILLFNDDTKQLLYTIAEHAGTGAFSTFKISSYPGNFFNAGQCIFALDSTAGATWMGSNAPLMDISADRVVNFETEVMTVPQFDPDAPQMISQGPSVCVFNKEDPQEVLAAWLFTQFLLTDEVQTAYAETEGYVPVTLKARQSDEYRDYLSREGEDNSKYYYVKLRASKLLLDNVGNTFVTPVFNGSASLRDAAGQLIENVTKSMRRKETVNDAYMDKLFDDVRSLYRLNQVSGADFSGKAQMGPLPKTSKALLGSLAGIWVLIGIAALISFLKKKKR
ncbi:MAG: extracellular solute-binding protein, partial [Oscillospiraceae bacterium]|nr:extracellular solute-binding protein [Oscillospiraceae bacterium]